MIKLNFAQGCSREGPASALIVGAEEASDPDASPFSPQSMETIPSWIVQLFSFDGGLLMYQWRKVLRNIIHLLS